MDSSGDVPAHTGAGPEYTAADQVFTCTIHAVVDRVKASGLAGDVSHNLRNGLVDDLPHSAPAAVEHLVQRLETSVTMPGWHANGMASYTKWASACVACPRDVASFVTMLPEVLVVDHEGPCILGLSEHPRVVPVPAVSQKPHFVDSDGGSQQRRWRRRRC